MEHGHIVRNCAHRRHVMGDGHGCGPHLGHNLADQIVDHTGHDGIKPGGGFVEKNNLGFCGNGPGQAHALLHAPRQFSGQAVRHIRCQTHASQFFDGNLTRLIPRFRKAAAQQAKGHVLPDGQRVKQRTALKQHSKAGQEGVAVRFGHIRAVHGDCAAVGDHEAEHGLDRHGLASARSTDDDHRGAFGHVQINAAQHLVGAKAFVDIIECDHAGRPLVGRRSLPLQRQSRLPGNGQEYLGNNEGQAGRRVIARRTPLSARNWRPE
mmetsp:Transcript_23722/g.42454  ORF Transcript_23722/g.42454 Transcript_23722/m.42454 type:complete len:265 (+) Transcript_23722:1237-2031(+)